MERLTGKELRSLSGFLHELYQLRSHEEFTTHLITAIPAITEGLFTSYNEFPKAGPQAWRSLIKHLTAQIPNTMRASSVATQTNIRFSLTFTRRKTRAQEPFRTFSLHVNFIKLLCTTSFTSRSAFLTYWLWHSQSINDSSLFHAIGTGMNLTSARAQSSISFAHICSKPYGTPSPSPR
mgnify:CR=1 FL=1